MKFSKPPPRIWPQIRVRVRAYLRMPDLAVAYLIVFAFARAKDRVAKFRIFPEVKCGSVPCVIMYIANNINSEKIRV